MASDDVEQSGLAGATGPQDDHELSARDLQRDLTQGRCHDVVGAVLLADTLDLTSGPLEGSFDVGTI